MSRTRTQPDSRTASDDSYALENGDTVSVGDQFRDADGRTWELTDISIRRGNGVIRRQSYTHIAFDFHVTSTTTSGSPVGHQQRHDSQQYRTLSRTGLIGRLDVK